MSSQSKDIHDKVIEVLKDISSIKEVTSGYVPPITNITKFPSIAVDFAVTRRKEGKTPNTMDTVEEIDIYLYNQQKSNKFEDILTDLVIEIDKALQLNTVLRDTTISCYISEVLSDGGILHPQGGRAMARLTLYVYYIERCTRY